MMLKFYIAVFAILWQFPNVVFAHSLYLGAGAGYGQTGLERPAQISFFQRNGATWSGWMGFALNQNLAAEGGYVRMDNVKAAGIINGLDVKDTVEPSMGYVVAKGSLPVTDWFVAILKVGGAYVYGKEKLEIAGIKTIRSQHKIRPFFAIGADFPINQYLSLTTTCVTTTKKDLIPRLSTVLFGVNYVIT